MGLSERAGKVAGGLEDFLPAWDDVDRNGLESRICTQGEYALVQRPASSRAVFGSPQAGPRVAAILSVIESCRRIAIPVREYLADILPGLADTPVRNVTGLTPKAWATKTNV